MEPGSGVILGMSLLQRQNPAVTAGPTKKVPFLIPILMGSPQLSTSERSWHAARLSLLLYCHCKLAPAWLQTGPR